LIAPRKNIPDREPDELSVLRELLRRNHCAAEFGGEILAQLLYAGRIAAQPLTTFEVECARTALEVEEEIRA
jgi:hypothetical protein